jgi:hypothetical protein
LNQEFFACKDITPKIVQRYGIHLLLVLIPFAKIKSFSESSKKKGSAAIVRG